jgi:chromate transporter
VAGALAAALVTWFTFLPSFLFILAGGPLVESTHDDLKFTAPLVAITAAVVGVVVNLAVFFAYHVWWPSGFSGQFDWIAASISALTLIALFGFKRSIMQVLGAAALMGACLSLFGLL